MRIDLLAPPFSGHLHPVLAMARQLAPHHAVRVISTASAMERVRVSGVPGRAILDAADEALLMQIANPPYPVKSNPLRMNQQFRRAIVLMGRVKAALLALYHRDQPDLIIADFTLPAAGQVAQMLGIVWWTSMPSPSVIETPDGPPAYMGGLHPAHNRWQRLQHALARGAVRGFKTLIFNLHRDAINQLGLRQLYRQNGNEAIYSPSCLLALGVKVFEFDRQWPKATRFVGPMLYTPPNACPPPRFIAGRQHVLVTAGTHLAWIKDSLAAATLKLAQALPDVVFHFSDGDESAANWTNAHNFVRLPYIDYERHLDSYSLVVHHGGAGILYYCLLMGKPAIVYPIDYDQFDHAARLENAGLAWWLRDLRQLPAFVRRALLDASSLTGLAGMQSLVRDTIGQHMLLDLLSQLARAKTPGSGGQFSQRQP